MIGHPDADNEGFQVAAAFNQPLATATNADEEVSGMRIVGSGILQNQT